MFKLSTTLPDLETNGLLVVHSQVVADPDHTFYVLARMGEQRRNVERDSGVVTPTLRIEHIEVLPDHGDGWFADNRATQEVLQLLHEQRTGRAPLPSL